MCWTKQRLILRGLRDVYHLAHVSGPNLCMSRHSGDEGVLMNRWHATIFYRTDAGTVDVEHDLEELSDLHDVVERGPHWDTVEKITVVRSKVHIENLTVEEAEKL